MALIGGAASTTSSLKTLSAESGTLAINVPAMELLIDCYESIKGKELESVGADEEIMGQLTNKLTELGPLHS